jgi:hypothetical protein
MEEKGGRQEAETTLMIEESDPSLMFAPRRVDLEEKRQAELRELMRDDDDDEDEDDEEYEDSNDDEQGDGNNVKKNVVKKSKSVNDVDSNTQEASMEELYPNGFVVDVINFD